MQPDLSVFEREVYRRMDLGEDVHALAVDLGLPPYVVRTAAARGDASLAGIPHASQAYEVRLYSLARRRPALFQIGPIPWSAKVNYADESAAEGVDTDDIDDPFGLQASNGGLLGGIV